MRLLSRNKRVLWYALYKSHTQILDEHGRITGSYKAEYEKPVRERLNVSPAMGEATVRQFGDDIAYDRTIAAPVSLPVDEQTVWWIDIQPLLEKDGTLALDKKGKIKTPWDYVTKKVAPSLNSSLIAVSKVIHNGKNN